MKFPESNGNLNFSFTVNLGAGNNGINLQINAANAGGSDSESCQITALAPSATTATSYAPLNNSGFNVMRTVQGLAEDAVIPTGNTDWKLWAGGALVVLIASVVVAKYII